MKALLLKDFYLLRQLTKLYMIMLLIYSVIAGFIKNFGFLSGVNISLFTIMPLTTLNFDASSHWNGYAAACPVSRKTIALEKYLLALILWGIGMGITFFMGITFRFINKDIVTWEEIFSTLWGQTMMLFLDNAIAIPAVYKFGPEKGKYIMMAGLIIPLLLFVMATDHLQFLFTAPVLMISLICIPVLLFASSIPLSVHICQNMED
jgi:predicted membrane protein